MICAVMVAYGTSLVLIDPAEASLFPHTFGPSIRQRINGWRLGMQEIGCRSAGLAVEPLPHSTPPPLWRRATATALLKPP
ncbi:MFS transporter, partial [Streptomyces sp. BE133]|nr:MFS transporter [Streptomyces sp. BE133]